MENSNKKNYPTPDDINITNVASSTECTGLFQQAPYDENQIDSYNEIYDIPMQTIKAED